MGEKEKMQGVVVTLKSNVELDEEGKVIINDQGEMDLINEDDVGILTKTHCIQVSQIDPNTNAIVTGVIFRSEIYWDERRNPSPAMVDPEDLVWISFSDRTEEQVEEDQEENDDYALEGNEEQFEQDLNQ
jgi:hypothetical protein